MAYNIVLFCRPFCITFWFYRLWAKRRAGLALVEMNRAEHVQQPQLWTRALDDMVTWGSKAVVGCLVTGATFSLSTLPFFHPFPFGLRWVCTAPQLSFATAETAARLLKALRLGPSPFTFLLLPVVSSRSPPATLVARQPCRT